MIEGRGWRTVLKEYVDRWSHLDSIEGRKGTKRVERKREWEEIEGRKGVDGTEKGGKGSYRRDYGGISFIQRSTVRFFFCHRE